jgi:hypothetical protein
MIGLQHLAVRLPHDVSWVDNACSEDPCTGNGGGHERAMPQSESAWCNVIASCCKQRAKASRDPPLAWLLALGFSLRSSITIYSDLPCYSSTSTTMHALLLARRTPSQPRACSGRGVAYNRTANCCKLFLLTSSRVSTLFYAPRVSVPAISQTLW